MKTDRQKVYIAEVLDLETNHRTTLGVHSSKAAAQGSFIDETDDGVGTPWKKLIGVMGVYWHRDAIGAPPRRFLVKEFTLDE